MAKSSGVSLPARSPLDSTVAPVSPSVAAPSGCDFVTGATGCVGRQMVRQLLASGRRIICAVRQPETLSEDPLFQSDRLTLIPCDFTQDGWQDSVQAVLNQCENVFHIAGEMPHRPTCHFDVKILRKVNLDAVIHMAGLAETAHMKRFLFISSVAVYGDAFAEARDEASPFETGDVYSETKVAAEDYLRQMARRGNTAALIIRPGLIYGERDNGVIQKIIRLIDKGHFLITGDGSNVRATSSASLVAETLLGLAKTNHSLLVLNVVDPRCPTLNQLTRDIAQLLGVRPPWHLPKSMVYAGATVFSFLAHLGWGSNFKVSDVRKCSSSNPIDTAHFTALFGTAPDHYQKELAADVAWYRSRQSTREVAAPAVVSA